MPEAATSPHVSPMQLPFGKDIEVFYDADCPLCQREIDLLRRRDRRQRIVFTSITDVDFPGLGKTRDELMAEIHGRLPDGTVISGVEVFRKLYSAVGFAWLMPATRLFGVRHALDFGYRMFARNRLRLTGRCDASGCAISETD